MDDSPASDYRLSVGHPLPVACLLAAATSHDLSQLRVILKGGGIYALIINDRAYIGETGVYEARFATYDDLNHGNKRLVAARKDAVESSTPIVLAPILPLPPNILATIRHTFETFVVTRARTTWTPHLNVNVWDSDFFKTWERFTGAEVEAFMIAVKDHLESGKLLPAAGHGRWIDVFGTCFSTPISDQHLSAMVLGRVRNRDVAYFRNKVGLVITDHDWEGRVRSKPGLKRQTPQRSAAQARQTLQEKFAGNNDAEDAFFSAFGIMAKKPRKLR